MDIKLDTVYNCDCMELMEEMRRGGDNRKFAFNRYSL